MDQFIQDVSVLTAYPVIVFHVQGTSTFKMNRLIAVSNARPPDAGVFNLISLFSLFWEGTFGLCGSYNKFKSMGEESSGGESKEERCKGKGGYEEKSECGK